MIKLIENNHLPSVNFTDGFSVTKIKANFLSYGCGYDFLRVWYQKNENGPITALIEKFENSIFIAADPTADMNEIKEFISVIGYTSVQATPDILSALGLSFKEYQVLEYSGITDGSLPPYPNIKEVYSLLFGEKNEHIAHTDFEGFYADLSHKIRRGTAAAIILENAAVCVASHITTDSAVISGVAVKKAARKNGLGSRVLNQLITSLKRRKIFVAAEKSVVPFYIKNKFKKAFKTAIYEAKEY